MATAASLRSCCWKRETPLSWNGKVGFWTRWFFFGVCTMLLAKVLFSSQQKFKKIQNFPSHQILRHMHEALNINKNKN